MTDLDEAFAQLAKLKAEDGWYRAELKRAWSHGDPEKAHWGWECTVGRYTASGGMDSSILQRCLTSGHAFNVDPALAIAEAVQTALYYQDEDADKQVAESHRLVAQESEARQKAIDAWANEPIPPDLPF